MTETTRRRDVTPTHTEWSVHGPDGAVSFTVHHETGTQTDAREQDGGQDFYGPIGLHYSPNPVHPPESALPLGDCHLLDGGTCHGDSTWRHGRDLGERWNATGRRDETIYTELDEWYTSRFTN